MLGDRTRDTDTDVVKNYVGQSTKRQRQTP